MYFEHKVRMALEKEGMMLCHAKITIVLGKHYDYYILNHV